MDDYSYINEISQSENIRFYILEHALSIEMIVSQSLGNFLNIDWEKSKSFGNGSSSLSFNQKVQIIQDLKGLDKTEVQKLTDLMVIRNKFAHVKSVETFKDLFETGSSGKTVKKNLDRFYSNKFSEFKVDDEEFKYKFYFFHLFFDILLLLIKMNQKHAFEKGEKDGELKILNALKIEIINSENGKEIMKKAIEKVKQELKLNKSE